VKFHNTLNPALFDDEHLDPQVRKQILEIAQDFIDHLGISDLEVKDITISGSNAAYTYTIHSDIDVHIIVDIDKLQNDEIYRELFTAKKTVYNDTHDITIHGYDVELYVEDSREPVKSLGEYSVLKDKWNKMPIKRRANFDERTSKSKFTKLVQLAQLALESDDVDLVQRLLDTIRRYRQAGLDEHGEFGPENLAYKAMRSQGIVDQLYDHRDQLHAAQLSIDEDWHPNDTPPGPEFKPTMPAGTVRVDVSDVYDWYKLGQHISNLKGLGKHDFGSGPPSTIFSFGSEDQEHKYIKDLEKTGLTTTDIDPVDPNQPKNMRRQKVDPTFNVNEGDDDQYNYRRPSYGDVTRVKNTIQQAKPTSKLIWKKPNQIAGSHTTQELKRLGFKLSQYGGWGGTEAMWSKLNPQSLREFAPGNGDDGLPYAEYVVYQCDPNDQFEFIGGPLYQTDSLGMAHKYAYEKYVKHRPKAFVIYQPHTEVSRGNYGVKGVSDEELNEFAVDGFGDSGDHRSKLLANVGRLFDAGNKIDWKVPGQMGHVIRVREDGITMKPYNRPYSRKSYFLPMTDDSRDSKYQIKMIKPKHYAVVSSDESWNLEETIKLRSTNSDKAKNWINKVYELYPHTFQNNHVMVWGEGDSQQFAMFELIPSISKRDAVEVKWFQAYPLRQGVGSRAMNELQRLAREDGIQLTLYPWDKGQVSQAKLIKFYKKHGFQPTVKGSKNMMWQPTELNEASGYIPSEKERNDPRFKTALTVDVKPDSIKQNAKKLGLGNIARAGIPQTARANGKF
jgi:GNAT superfamily N-acetyltransferase